MGEFEIHFDFFINQGDDPVEIPDDVKNQLRREVATIFEEAHFGALMETDNHYANVYAVPVTDTYFREEGRLHIGFHFIYPLAHGDIGKLLSDGVAKMYNFVWGSPIGDLWMNVNISFT